MIDAFRSDWQDIFYINVYEPVFKVLIPRGNRMDSCGRYSQNRHYKYDLKLPKLTQIVYQYVKNRYKNYSS
jgi:hypothetical protein